MPYMLDSARPRTRASTRAQQQRPATAAASPERPGTASSDNFSASGPAQTLLDHAAESESADESDDDAPELMGTAGDAAQAGRHVAREADERSAPVVVGRREGGVGGDVAEEIASSEAGTGTGTEDEAFHTAIEGLDDEDEDQDEDEEEFHTDPESGSEEDEPTEVQGVTTAAAALPATDEEVDGATSGSEEDGDGEEDTLVPDADEPPRLPMELLKEYDERGSVEPTGRDQLVGTTNKQRRRMRKNEIRRKKKQWLRLQKDVRGTGVIPAGKAAQNKRGIMAAKGGMRGVKSEKIEKATKPAVSGRQRLMEDRKRAASGPRMDTRDFKKARKT
ncbi:hypothetical protein MBLNU230_g7475t1 [Neophaeotheca triangularis]